MPQGYLHSPTICHRIVAEHLDELEPPGVQLTHYTDDVILQGKNVKVVKSLMLLIEHMKSKGWEINPAKIQGSVQTINFLGIQ